MTTALEKVNGTPVASDDGPRFDPVALAKADAIRKQAEAEAERQRIANERAAMRLEKEKAQHDAHIAEVNRKREESERAAAAARHAETAEKQAEAATAGRREKSAKSWRNAALAFAIACGIVALPVQMSAFYDKDALWLLAAPLMLEGGAWVVLKGAAAAVDDHRPHWHYRTIAWILAAVAASINLAHGLHAFDAATAIGTAFASLAGPGVWDLHEHGRIRVRDGKLPWRQRRAQKKAEEKAAKEKAAKEKAAAKAAEEAAAELAAEREREFPDVWKHARRLAAALGETTVTEAVWKRAHRDIEGADPGDSVDIIRTRNANEKRVAAARAGTTVNAPGRGSSPQAAPQVPGVKKPRVYSPPARRGVRTKGDTKYAPAARRQMSHAAKSAAQKNA